MSNDNQNNSTPDALDRMLDEALEQIVREEPTHEMIERSATSTWDAISAMLSTEKSESPQGLALRSCEDYQKLIPAFLSRELNEARSMLLQDHSRGCVPCRKAIKEAREDSREKRSGIRTSGKAGAQGSRKLSRSTGQRWKADLTWGLAAAVILGIALVGFAVNTSFFQFQTAGILRVEAIDGSLMEVGDVQTAQLASGQSLENGEWIKTAKGSGAKISLEDGSIIELAERSQLYVTREGDNDTIHLERGNIIVQAARQGSGTLFVETGDCNVAVTGTVFSVSNGLKGSRVSVIEGQVIVRHGSRVDTLYSGQQITTAENLHPIPVSRDIAWSDDLEAHMTLLAAMSEFQTELNERLPANNLRYKTDLLEQAPVDTVIYVAIPNLTEHISSAHDLMMEKVAANGALAQLWKDETRGRDVSGMISEIMTRVQKYGPMIDDEIILTLQDGDGTLTGPVVMARLNNPEALREELLADLVLLNAHAEGEDALFLLDENMAGGEGGGMKISIQDDLLVIAPTLDSHRAVAGGLSGSGFSAGSFRESLKKAYDDGSGILFGADLATLLEGNVSDQNARTVMGIDNIRHLIMNRREIGDRTETEATVSFAGERAGVASWLAEPAPMGALEFVSPDATAVGGFVVKNPSSLVEELFAMLPGSNHQEFLEDFRDSTGLDLLVDVVAPLGGEIVFALDGPILPKPAWKLVMEVYDPVALQHTIEMSAAKINATAEAGSNVELRSKEIGGRTFWALISEAAPQIHYTFVEGYLVVAPRRVFLDRAIKYRESGVTLPASRQFAALLPDNGRMNFSAMVYQNLGQILGPLMNTASGFTGQLSPEQRAGMQQLIDNLKPSLYLVYGEKDRIVFTGTDRTGLLGTDLGSMFNLGSILSMGEMLQQGSMPNSSNPVYDNPGGKDPGEV